MLPTAARSWNSSAAGSASVSGSISRTISPAMPWKASGASGAGQGCGSAAAGAEFGRFLGRLCDPLTRSLDLARYVRAGAMAFLVPDVGMDRQLGLSRMPAI